LSSLPLRSFSNGVFRELSAHISTTLAHFG
jgi:hypothetical protein